MILVLDESKVCNWEFKVLPLPQKDIFICWGTRFLFGLSCVPYKLTPKWTSEFFIQWLLYTWEQIGFISGKGRCFYSYFSQYISFLLIQDSFSRPYGTALHQAKHLTKVSSSVYQMNQQQNLKQNIYIFCFLCSSTTPIVLVSHLEETFILFCRYLKHWLYINSTKKYINFVWIKNLWFIAFVYNFHGGFLV